MALPNSLIVLTAGNVSQVDDERWPLILLFYSFIINYNFAISTIIKIFSLFIMNKFQFISVEPSLFYIKLFHQWFKTPHLFLFISK